MYKHIKRIIFEKRATLNRGFGPFNLECTGIDEPDPLIDDLFHDPNEAFHNMIHTCSSSSNPDIHNSSSIIDDSMNHTLLTSVLPDPFCSDSVGSDSEDESIASACWDFPEHVLDAPPDNASAHLLPDWPALVSAMPQAAIPSQTAINTPPCWQTDSSL